MPIKSKRTKRVMKTADNAFSAYTGIPVIKLTGTNSPDCWICAQQRFNNVPVKKVSAAIHDPETMNGTITQGHREMSLMRVSGTCGVDQCVNPEHLSVSKKEYNPWA
jgi:alkylhydroperoxidase family enzyme